MAPKGGHENTPPFFTALGTLALLTVVYVLGKLRELISPAGRRHPRKGYAPVREKDEDFYDRRVFRRISDLWNRPIASAPGAWIDVMERDAKAYSSGFAPLCFTGTTRRCLNLGSYNYLGFAAADEYCTPRVQATIKEFGVSSCSSRTDSGTTSIHVELERAVAEFVGCEAAIVYGMGYVTNSAVIPALFGKGCLIISDALNHASIVVGARASGAKVKVFRHNDAAHLDAILRNSIAEGQPRSHRPWKKIVVIVEGIYSMEGEACRLRDIVEVKKKYRVYLYLDEAHSIGALGRTGRGCCEYWGVSPKDVDIMMGTFTKSFGSCGGYIAGSQDLIRYLKRHGPAHLYAAAIAPPAAQQILSAIKLINGEDGTTRGKDKVKQLHDNANYFRLRLLEMGLHVLGDWDSPVMPIMIYHSGKLAVFSRLCLEHHVAVVMVGFPASSVLLVRTRVCISASHTREDLDYALEVISHVSDECMLKYRSLADVGPQVQQLLASAPNGVSATIVEEAQEGHDKGRQCNGHGKHAPAVAEGKSKGGNAAKANGGSQGAKGKGEKVNGTVNITAAATAVVGQAPKKGAAGNVKVNGKR